MLMELDINLQAYHHWLCYYRFIMIETRTVDQKGKLRPKHELTEMVRKAKETKRMLKAAYRRSDPDFQNAKDLAFMRIAERVKSHELNEELIAKSNHR